MRNLVIVGSNSRVWQRVRRSDSARFDRVAAIGHAAVPNWSFRADDEVWVLSYANSERGNSELLDALAARGVGRMVYVSTVSTRVCEVTSFYRYPRIKLAAERHARAVHGATVVVLGLVCADQREAPAGLSMVTWLSELADLMHDGIRQDQVGTTILLAKPVHQPFCSRFEEIMYRCYGQLIGACGPWPFLLRPLDLVLKHLGCRWYGYFRVGNQLWTSIT